VALKLSQTDDNFNRLKNPNSSQRSSNRFMLIPGIDLPAETPGSKIFLLHGPSGVGKTLYCRQFLLEGLLRGDQCIFVSTSLSKMQFKSLFSNVESGQKLAELVRFFNPYEEYAHLRDNHKAVSGRKLLNTILSDVTGSLKSIKRTDRKAVSAFSAPGSVDLISNSSSGGNVVRLVIDSLTHLMMVVRERTLMQFVIDLTHILRNINTTAILTVTTSSLDGDSLLSNLGSVVDGVIETRLKEDSAGSENRTIRVRHIKGTYHEPKWITFKISANGNMLFSNRRNSSLLGTAPQLTCTLCAKPIMGTPIVRSDFVFDSKECMEIFQRLENAYGSKISDTGLPSEAFDASFFFIDVVGLSDPTLSVKNQVHKIEKLNELIYSCDAYRKVSAGKKIILPTGDGMAVGFPSKPEIPLELSIQLHHKLGTYNDGKPPSEEIGVRIGLASGPVFTVADLNNVQNIWGPGIILARRVMDAGDKGHILIAESLAETLLSLKDEYRHIITLVADKYRIKHGQKIKLYSAYSDDFGNPQIPSKVIINEE
jgi:KaiC/GvpD/RAD55 family RecA-like ATPase